MIELSIQPTMSELYDFIDKVPKFPISVKNLLGLADKLKTSKEVKQFYSLFDHSEVFKSRSDLAGRSEQLEVLHEDSKLMPEEVQVPEEY